MRTRIREFMSFDSQATRQTSPQTLQFAPRLQYRFLLNYRTPVDPDPDLAPVAGRFNGDAISRITGAARSYGLTLSWRWR